jgi:redox-sensitive bicupin YhaK (pirin superfamily)
MTLTLRPSAARGHARHGWLDSRHSFSFADYHDPAQMGFRSLRVINEDIIDGGSGFATHPHRDMEIISYVVEGALAHQDSTGAAGVIRPGDVQVMSAGTGVRHSEFNHLDQARTRFLQIWILPAANGLSPRYGDISVAPADKLNQLRLVVAPQADHNVLPINQDARVYASLLQQGHSLGHPLAAGRGAWLQLVSGAITLNGTALAAGDGAAVTDVAALEISAQADSELLLFDLA